MLNLDAAPPVREDVIDAAHGAILGEGNALSHIW